MSFCSIIVLLGVISYQSMNQYSSVYSVNYRVRNYCALENTNAGRSYSNVNLEISDCFFRRLTQYSGNGGVIYIVGASYSMSLSYIMFYNCQSNYGGAIFFNSSNSVMKMICANRCSALSYHFAFLYASELNQVEYQSISACSYESIGFYSIYVYKGNQTVDNTNSSMNTAERMSAIGIIYPSSFKSTFCTFSNNNATDRTCLWFYYYSGKMEFANIVHNYCPSSYAVIMSYQGFYKFHYCIFDMNQIDLFRAESGTFEIAHCFINHTGLVSTGSNNSFTQKETYFVQFFNSHYCFADNPLPKRSPMLTLMETMTIQETPIDTPYQTPEITLRETIIETNDDISNTWNIIIWGFVIIILIGIVCLLVYCLVLKTSDSTSSQSGSKKDIEKP